jgi:hypothetical protein
MQGVTDCYLHGKRKPMNTAVVPVEQREVEFYGDELIAIRSSDGHIYVAIGQMCDALGIDRASQVRRIRNDEILVAGYQGSVNLTYPDGGTQSSGVLRLDLIPLWLTGLRIKAVSEEIRPKLKRFKQEASKILWEAFQDGRLTADSSFDELLQTDSEAVQAYKMALAVVKLARNQVLLEARLDRHEKDLVQHGERLEQIEATLGSNERQVTPDQASQISQAVKAVALALGKKTKRNEFGACYGELYRRYGITSYKALPAHKFEDALNFLTEWHQDITTNVPF